MTDQPELFAMTDAEAADLAETADQMLSDPALKARWPERLSAIYDVARSAVATEGLPDDQIDRIATKAVIAWARYEGGRCFYLPTHDAIERALRDRRMFHRWQTGRADPHQLAEETGKTYARIMQILHEQRALWRKRHEPGLPGF